MFTPESQAVLVVETGTMPRMAHRIHFQVTGRWQEEARTLCGQLGSNHEPALAPFASIAWEWCPVCLSEMVDGIAAFGDGEEDEDEEAVS